MKARDIMTSRNLCTASLNASCRQVAQLMAECDIGSVPVLDDDARVVGICTDRDLAVRLLAPGRSFDTPVSQIMSQDVKAAHPDDDLIHVEQIMESFQIRRVPIVDDDGVLVGFIATADLARHAPAEVQEHEVAEVLQRVSQSSGR